MLYLVTVATMVCIYIILASGLNIITGYAGQSNLGHAAFFGIGAYSSALLTTKAGLSFWAALPLAILIAAAVGFVLGIISLRLKEDFLAITTIGVNFVVVSVFLYFDFFGRALGLGGIPRPSVFGHTLNKPQYLILVLIFVALVTTLPEVVVTISALRLGAVDLAVGDLLGSLMANTAMLGLLDFFYFDGPLLRAAAPEHASTGILAIIMVGIAVAELIYRPQKKALRRMSLGAFLLAFLYAGNIILQIMSR